jgi:hypothetical protein
MQTSLNQLKSRLTWEIQALTDKRKRCEVSSNPEAAKRIVQIDERLAALRLLQKARLAMQGWRRRYRKAEAAMQVLIRNEITKLQTAVASLRAGLAI